MSFLATCTRCNLTYRSRLFNISNAENFTISNISETCPRCGGEAKLQSGAYDFTGSVITSFRSLSREKLTSLRDLAQQVERGELAAELAQLHATSAGPAADNIFRTAMAWGLPGLFVALISLWLQISGDAADADQADRMEALFREQLAAQTQMVEQMKQISKTPEPLTLPAHSHQKPPSTQSQTSEPANCGRAERRRAWKAAQKVPGAPPRNFQD